MRVWISRSSVSASPSLSSMITAQVIDAPSRLPSQTGGALQFVGAGDVEHQEAVDQLDQGLAVEVRRQQVGVARFHAAVAAHIEVPARVGGDDADVLALGFRTLAGTAGDAELHLVRGANAFVAVLEEDPEADAVLHAEAAPGAADAGLGHAQCLGVGLTGFESGADAACARWRQIILLGPEQADALGAGDLVER